MVTDPPVNWHLSFPPEEVTGVVTLLIERSRRVPAEVVSKSSVVAAVAQVEHSLAAVKANASGLPLAAEKFIPVSAAPPDMDAANCVASIARVAVGLNSLSKKVHSV